MAIGYKQFKNSQEMQKYLDSKVSAIVNGKTVFMWYTHRETALKVEFNNLRVYESIYCPELDY